MESISPFWGFIVLCIVLIGIFMVWLHRHPADLAKFEALVARFESGAKGIIASLDGNSHVTSSNTQAVAATVPKPETPPPAGKSGSAGVMTLNVTGDPAKDLAAFNAAYFGQ